MCLGGRVLVYIVVVPTPMKMVAYIGETSSRDVIRYDHGPSYK